MNALFSMFLERKEELLDLFIQHLNMTTLAVLISLVVGIPLGLLITKNKPVASVVIGIANLLQSIPSIALLAFMVPFVGIGEKPA
ncbi:MAG TPA: ABC transporter substrate-binding protein, partial [Ruminococcaceae bacterium]|nr:ABC transporter substrate-binding protein [Oscillospiraceae bacterium]